jgi:predicted acylesterase/phospholipase RssA
METSHCSDEGIGGIRSGGDDAVCFTSGPAGAPFAAGVIHAWLAIDRRRPLVSSGISMGAISAAAMRRVYQELDDERPLSLEEKRWTWFRRYLNAVTDNPLKAIWEALPNPVDFSATTSPVTDKSVPVSLKVDAEEARRHYHILTKLGVWVAGLPVRLSTVATILVMTVRKKEGYGFPTKHWLYGWNWSKAVIGVWWHIIFSPSFFYEGGYDTDNRRPGRRNLFGLIEWRPLFREIWWFALGLALAMPILIVFLSVDLEHYTSWRGLVCFLVVSSGAIVAVVALVIVGTKLYSWISRWRDTSSVETTFIAWILSKVDVDRALLHSYEASRQLYDLFIDRAPASAQRATESDVRLLIVCAALERTQQVCLRHEMRVMDALLAATAVPGLFKPTDNATRCCL